MDEIRNQGNKQLDTVKSVSPLKGAIVFSKPLEWVVSRALFVLQTV
jgi:hypothetical protein